MLHIANREIASDEAVKHDGSAGRIVKSFISQFIRITYTITRAAYNVYKLVCAVQESSIAF